jgi:hypothetical protein
MVILYNTSRGAHWFIWGWCRKVTSKFDIVPYAQKKISNGHPVEYVTRGALGHLGLVQEGYFEIWYSTLFPKENLFFVILLYTTRKYSENSVFLYQTIQQHYLKKCEFSTATLRGLHVSPRGKDCCWILKGKRPSQFILWKMDLRGFASEIWKDMILNVGL